MVFDRERLTSLAQLQRLRSQVFMVCKHFKMWAQTRALENIVKAFIDALDLSWAEASELANCYLQHAGMYHRNDGFPAPLPGGEPQRVAMVGPWL